MHIILLTFAEHRADAPQHLAAHEAWLQRGHDHGVFLLWGTLAEGRGGAILAHNATTAEVEARVREDPFVEHSIVTAQVLHVTPAFAAECVKFLRPQVAAA